MWQSWQYKHGDHNRSLGFYWLHLFCFLSKIHLFALYLRLNHLIRAKILGKILAIKVTARTCKCFVKASPTCIEKAPKNSGKRKDVINGHNYYSHAVFNVRRICKQAGNTTLRTKSWEPFKSNSAAKTSFQRLTQGKKISEQQDFFGNGHIQWMHWYCWNILSQSILFLT